jgi:hypothetical protein
MVNNTIIDKHIMANKNAINGPEKTPNEISRSGAL